MLADHLQILFCTGELGLEQKTDVDSPAAQFRREVSTMSTELVVLVVVLILLFGGGGFYWSRRG